MNIVVCITTHNRNEITDKCISQWARYMPTCADLFVVDDGSTIPYPNADYRFEKSQGVGAAKNACLKLSEKYDYVFLSDNDIWPIKIDWHIAYIHSGLEHACFNINRPLIKFGVIGSFGRADYYAEYETPNGCMLFFTRKVIDTVGGWDTSFKGYGYEHVNVSDRIYNAGLTPARYIDIPNSKGLFEMADCESSFTSADRSCIPANYALYQKNFLSKEFKPFK